jgi:biotin synthase
MNARNIVTIGEMVLDGRVISREDAAALAGAGEEDIPLLGAYANKIRARFAGKTVDMCGVVNARAGMCPEDCKFCAQSVHAAAGSPVFPLIAPEEALAAVTRLVFRGWRPAGQHRDQRQGDGARPGFRKDRRSDCGGC